MADAAEAGRLVSAHLETWYGIATPPAEAEEIAGPALRLRDAALAALATPLSFRLAPVAHDYGVTVARWMKAAGEA